MKATVEAYGRKSKIRQEIVDGDLVMFRGGPLHDRIIEIGSGAYCHSALAFRKMDPSGEDRVWLVQATKQDGVHLRLLSDELAKFEGGIEHWRIKEPFARHYVAQKALDAARSKVGEPYAMVPIYWFALDFITFGLFHLRDRSRGRKAFFCSELIAWACARGGVRLDPHHGMAATAPTDLVSHGRVEGLGAFAHIDAIAALERRQSAA
jgi:hypothetical protein